MNDSSEVLRRLLVFLDRYHEYCTVTSYACNEMCTYELLLDILAGRLISFHAFITNVLHDVNLLPPKSIDVQHLHPITLVLNDTAAIKRWHQDPILFPGLCRYRKFS
jgi:hypothetical protein